MTRIDFRQQEDCRQLQFLRSSSTITPFAHAAGRPVLLDAGRGIENLQPSIREAAVTFFRDRDIAWWRMQQGDDAASTGGPTRHALSSQVACVNLLLPLREDPVALRALLRAIDPEVERVLPIRYSQGGRSFESFVELEWTGQPTLEGSGQRGRFATSADALILAETRDGRRRAYLLEWKYVEQYAAGRCLGAGREGAVRRRRYRPLFDRVFLGGDEAFEALLFDPFYQFMRLCLLAERMRAHRELGADDAVLVLVRPRENEALRRRITSPALARVAGERPAIERAFRTHLREPAMFRWVSPGELVTAVTQERPASEWSSYLQSRYGLAPKEGS